MLPGCVSCQLYADVEDDNRLLLIEEWADVQSLRAHLRSDDFRVVLSALEYAASSPEVRFDTVSDFKDMGFITLCRERGRSEA